MTAIGMGRGMESEVVLPPRKRTWMEISTQTFGPLDAIGNLIVYGQRDFESCRCHRLQQQCTDRCINVTTSDRLACLSGAPYHLFLADIIRKRHLATV
jgi:hypothetical protein